MGDVKNKIPHELASLAPFFHDIDLGNGYNTAPESHRLKEMENMFFPILCSLCGGSLKGKRILDVGCNCGGFSFSALNYGAKEVTGIDSDPKNIRQANAVKKYLNVDNVHFLQMRAEEINLETTGMFDITIMAGLIYHLADPLGIIKRISGVTKSILMIDSHVHYSSDTTLEDIPSWWMLPDTDQNDLDGLFIDEPSLTEKYLEFKKSNSIDYSKLTNQFMPSPHTLNDMKFTVKNIPASAGEVRVECNIGSTKPGDLVFIPNKKALIKIVRFNGFEDVVEIIPHRFASLPYLGKFRVGIIALKREKDGMFPLSVIQSLEE